MAESADRDTLQKFYNFSKEKCEETLRNKSLTAALLKVALECDTQLKLKLKPLPPTAPPLLYTLASKLKAASQERHIPFIISYILSERIKTDTKLNAAILYVKNTIELNEGEFDVSCGIGVEVSPEQVEAVVLELIEANRDVILERRHKYNKGELVGKVRGILKWADGRVIKETIDSKIESLLGSKTPEDEAPRQRESKVTATRDTTPKQVPKAEESVQQYKYEVSGDALAFHLPGENYKTNGYITTPHTMELIRQHLEETGGKVITRFPPEPNGILHIGHAKAINFNFGYANATGGLTYLRYDDTNPEREEERFFREIREMVEWLGHKPYKVTHASDNFLRLYQLAVQLILSGNAYVDHQKQTEIQGVHVEFSKWRDRPIGESVKLFSDMKCGKIEEGKATLRMKFVMEDGKIDPVAYRIKFTPHPRTGDRWCIYPTYDYTHCLCDSIENITHSLCTKEFQARRSAYYWLCNSLRVYCPVQWEYSRLNLTYTVVSKRKIVKLINEGKVKDWDDPRLYTLTALRRRGVPPQAINRFCAKVGVTMTQTVIEPSMLDSCISEVLDVIAKRAMGVCDPLKVIITNFPQIEPIFVTIPDYPRNAKTSLHKVPLEKVVYIERSDVSEKLSTDFWRLAPGQPVGLRHTDYLITLQDITTDAKGAITEIKVSCSLAAAADKPKAWIHWVSQPIECELRLYERLFLHANPEDIKVVPGGFVTDCCENSLSVITALVDRSVEGAVPLDKFQFERIGFFSVDFDSTAVKMVFNRTLSLKESSGKAMN